MVNERKLKNRLVLIDGHSVLYRAYHAYPALTTKTGELIHAVYGFTSILLGVIHDLKPTHLAVTFDRGEPTFRHEEFDGYKASRPEAPEELITQQGRLAEVIDVLNIPVFSVSGFEADDVIGTLSKQAANKKDVEVVIVTGDQDAFQLVDDERVFVYTPPRGKKPAILWGAREVSEKYSLKPEQLIDYKALAGDSSDEIPGVKGIGPKTATLLLKKYTTLNDVYDNIDRIKGEASPSVYQKLVDGKELAYQSRKLAEIVVTVPIKLKMKACVIYDYEKQKAIEKFQELEFTSLIQKLPKDKFEQMIQEELFSE